jgi:hypothetical protein
MPATPSKVTRTEREKSGITVVAVKLAAAMPVKCMVEMAAPINSALSALRSLHPVGRLLKTNVSHNDISEPAIAISTESTTMGGEYRHIAGTQATACSMNNETQGSPSGQL